MTPPRPTGDYRTTRDGITVEIQHDWIAHPPERDIAPTGLGMCEFCEFDVLAGSEIASVNDGRYAHYDCVPWGDEEMRMPKRIQLRRTKGWRLPPGAMSVARPTRWGNPMTVAAIRAIERELDMEPAPIAKIRADLAVAFRSLVKFGPDSGYWSPDNYKAVLVICDGLNAGELRGKDLACWCPLDQPCHADVLLELANQDEP